MTEARIEKTLIDSADLNYQAAPALAKVLVQAQELIFSALTNGGKILVCGVGSGAVLAQHCTVLLAGRHERERPGLSAICLGSDSAWLAAHSGLGYSEAVARQLRALGQGGDVLLSLSVGAHAKQLHRVIDEAHERDIAVVAFSAADKEASRMNLLDTDVHVTLQHESAARQMEVFLVALHALCDGIDALLLGDQENE